MKHPFGTFLLRLALATPLCLWLWWLSFDTQQQLFQGIAGWLLESRHPNWQVIPSITPNGLIFKGPHLGEALMMDPYALTRGLPIYLALMFATVEGRRIPFESLLGLFLLGALALLAFNLEAELRILGWEGRPSGFGLNPETFQLGMKLILTRVLPLAVWFFQRRVFVRTQLGLSLGHPRTTKALND